MCDTNCDPEIIDFPIPSNDDAIRAVKLVTGHVADAVMEGLTLRGYDPEAEQPAAAPGVSSASPDDEPLVAGGGSA